MSKRYSAHTAKKLIDLYVNQIETQIALVQKNFNEMDFENADARNNMEDIIKSMKSNYRDLINELRSYHFS
ncbi:MAG: hypothetical protein GX660_15570 [Clostridiaceae bacterium]|nr:hypothetical protein [Clostridiaceae bacterium]